MSGLHSFDRFAQQSEGAAVVVETVNPAGLFVGGLRCHADDASIVEGRHHGASLATGLWWRPVRAQVCGLNGRPDSLRDSGALRRGQRKRGIVSRILVKSAHMKRGGVLAVAMRLDDDFDILVESDEKAKQAFDRE